ncbi:MAG: NDP-sugar synthase [Planctomycetota bacterium]|nr:NDP-sugar synthase [Planctomycetota bacterium]MEC8560145.1 NDP-sugar synthase [Planctomycetota bacterium]MEC8735207.1 NDP-sugar synthase [Planctomycetota bacterium]MEC9158414.1 NDP-sugar synthase [Planctomycetota bacterium]
MALNEVNVVILVGGPGQSSLRDIAGHSVSLLPVPGYRHCLHAWFEIVQRMDPVNKIHVLTGRPDDKRVIGAAAGEWDAGHLGQTGVHADHNDHRGTAGALRDFATSLNYSSDLLVIEGNRIPPSNPEALFDLEYDREDVIGVLGRDRSFQPSGLFLMKNRILDLIPEIGFFDLKEQLIPRALERGERILVRPTGEGGNRISDRTSYLQGVRELGARAQGPAARGPWIADGSHVHEDADVKTGTLVSEGCRIGAHSVVKDSVLLEGAVIGADCLIVDSVIKGGITLAPGTKVVRGAPYEGDSSMLETSVLS